MDEWDPRQEDYEDKTFNSYTKGPGRNLCIKKNYVKGSERHVQLYVTGIPDELTEDGLESLFGRAGTVIRVKKMMSKKENAGDTFGFITMASLSDAERAIAQYNNFKINRHTLHVSVSLSKEELEKKKQQRQDLGMLTARGFDEAMSDSDSSLKDLNNKPSVMNGLGNAGVVSSALGAGRGQRLREIAQKLLKQNAPVPVAFKSSLQNSSSYNIVSPNGYANLTSKKQPKAGSYPTSQLENLTVQVDKTGGHSVSHTIGVPLNLQTPVGRGRSLNPGRVTDNGYESGYPEDYSRPKKGKGGRGRGHLSRGRGQRGRGNNYRDYYNDYDGGYGGYQQPYMGRGMGFPSYPMPVYVADPYMSMMNSSHLLQPAYNQMMNSTLMNTTMQQQQQQQMAMPQQTPLPQPTPMPKKGGENKCIKQECSVCGKLGSSRCSNCKIPYCSAACQEKDWPEHRRVCHTISKETEASEAFSNFDVTVGDELIPQVKKLMEKATGDVIEVTKKSEYSPKPPSESGSTRSRSKPNEKRGQQSDNDDRSPDKRRSDTSYRRTEDRRGQNDDRRGQNDERRGQNDDRRDQRSRNDDENRARSDDRWSGRNNKDDKACFNCGETTHMKNECPKPNNYKIDCYNCKQKGHISKDCPERQGGGGGGCYNCHERGHISRDCPLKQENQLRNASNNNRVDNRRQGTSQPKVDDDEEWDDKPVSPQPVNSQKLSKPVCESTPKECKIATKKKSIPSPPPKKSLQAASMPLNQEVMVVLTAIEDPGHFYLQMAGSDTDKFQELMAVMLQTFASSQSDVNSVLQGEIYGARFSLDGSWNRAQVVSVSGDSIIVQFLDFGNKDTVKFDDLRQLTNEMMQLPAQGVLCALEDIEPKSGNSWNIPDLNKYISTDVPYNAECKRIVDAPAGRINKISLRTMDGENICEKLVSANLVISKTASNTVSPSPNVQQPRRDVQKVTDSKRATMPINQEVMVVLTTVEDPGNFYLQMAVDETEKLQDLMAVMHQTFESSPPDVKSAVPGEIYGARFSLDGSWNRAQVVSVSGDSIIVQFLDFGNKDTVKFDDLRQLTNEMMQLQAQGVLCALEGVEPKSGNSWNIPDLNNYIATDIPYKAECKRIVDAPAGRINEILLRNMDGEDVAKKLLAANLVRSKTVSNSKPSSAYVQQSERVVQQVTGSSQERLMFAKDLPKYVEKLRVDVEYPLMIADAKTPVDFSIQILNEENTTQFTAFNFQFNEECQRMTDTEYRPKSVGELVASQFSQEIGWYRAEVLELVSTGAKVLYIDYLNSETVTFTMMRKPPTMCKTFPIQGISCCMHNVHEPIEGKWPKEIFDLYEQFSRSALIGTVKEIKNDTVTMELRELSGELVNEKINSTLQKGAIKPQMAASREIKPGELPLDGSKMPVVVTNVSAVDSVYVQDTDANLEKIRNEMMLELNQSLTGAEREPYEPQEGEYVAAVYVLGGTAFWYRALVKVKVSENNFMVLFVDYGNEECVRTEAIAPLEPRLMTLPAMAIRCQLSGSEDVVDQQTLINLKSLTDNRMYVKAVDYVEGLYKVEMFLEDGTNVNEAFEFKTDKGAIAKVTKSPPKPETKSPPMSAVEARHFDITESVIPLDGTKVLSKVVLIDNLASFYCHKLDEEIDAKFMESLKAMQLHYIEDAQVYTGKIGEYVAALFDDGSGAVWYRAKILDFVENAVKVSIVDYGNVGLVERECVRQLKKEFTELPVVAVKCKLNGSTGTEKDETVQEFMAVQTTNVQVKGIEKQGDTYLVDLHLLDALETSVAELLDIKVEQPLKTPEKAARNSLSPIPVTNASLKSPVSARNQSTTGLSGSMLPLGVDVHAVTYVIESTKSFYVQKADDETQKDLATMMVQLAEVCQTNTHEHRASAGEIVAALFEDGGDSNWYRGQVIELIDSEQCKVIFVDYGNTENVKFADVRRLESRFLELPRMAIQCLLAGVAYETENMLQKFKTISNVPMIVRALSEQNGVFEVEVITSDNVNMNLELSTMISVNKSMSPSTDIVDHLPKAISPAKDRLPKKVTSPPKGERKAVFTQTLAKSRPTEDKFIAVITSVVRPNMFHCQVFKEGAESSLQDLQFLSETMQLECEVDFDNITSMKFEVGELCCARYPADNQWYRASVLEIFPDNTVKVEYVDFGNQTEVSSTQLRPVTEDYTRLPLLSFRCMLHGVRPAGGNWTKQVVEEMRKFQDKQLVAKVISVNKDVYELDLTDKDSDVNMAQHLIASGMAVADDTENEDISEMERLKREKELLQRQLEDMQAKMAAIQKSDK